MNWLRNFWNYISLAGVTDGMAFPIQKRVMLSNQFALVIGIIAISFTIILLSGPGANVAPTFTMLVLVSSIYFLNKNGYTKVSRFLVSIAPLLGLIFLNISIKLNSPDNIGMVHYVSPRMLMVSLIALPMTLFTFDEKKSLFLALIFPLGAGFFFEDIHDLFGISSEELGIDDEYQSTVAEDMILLIVLQLGTFLFLLNLNKQYEKINDNLLKDAAEKNSNLHRNEETLKKSLEELEVARQEDERRNWVTKGIAELSQTLRDNDYEDIYSGVITDIVKYLEVNQGGFYVADASEEIVSLHLKGCYAYGRKKFVEQNIEEGEGLLGQCYLEGTFIHLTEVPNDYIEITSGLGEATPSSLILMPLKVNNKVEGIIELASFDVFENHHIDYLEKIAESLAVFIANKRTTEQTKKLLEETESATQTLRSQETELRNSFEELQATKEEMEHKEKFYLEKIEQLELKINQSNSEKPA
ncbi:MAG: hypothetical protein CMO01_27710 [Thalassobius sp.]|nr:hypothetical protein [Thalassovita sp.]